MFPCLIASFPGTQKGTKLSWRSVHKKIIIIISTQLAISTLICFTPARRTPQIYSSGTSAGKSKLKILEIGCGPVIACQISAAPHTSEITMAELNHNVIVPVANKDPRTSNCSQFFCYVVRGRGRRRLLSGHGKSNCGEQLWQSSLVIATRIHLFCWDLMLSRK